MQTTDVLVIGAGPSGTVAAAMINKAGFDVIIIEKLQFPRFVIGESLLPRCLDALDEAGLLDALATKNFQEKSGAKFVRRGEVCDFSFSEQFTKGRAYAWQMPRADFDKALADECEKQGVTVRYRQEVVGIEIAADGSSITDIRDEITGEHYQIAAKFIVDGSGYGRVIPKLFQLESPSSQATRKTVFTHLTDPIRMEQEEPNRIVVFIPEDDVWVWTIPFVTGITSVGFVANPDWFAKFETSEDMHKVFGNLLQQEPTLAHRFKNADYIFEPKILQGWSATTSKFYGNGYVLTGNVTEFLDPIFSSGVTLATVSAQNAAKLVIKHLNGIPVDWEKEYAEPTMSGVAVFRTYVNAWYDGSLFKIFFSDKKTTEVKSRICSVLAGYVWDEENTFVKHHQKSISTVLNYITTIN